MNMSQEQIQDIANLAKGGIGLVVGHQVAEITTKFIDNTIGEQTGIKKIAVGLTSFVVAGMVCEAIDDYLERTIGGIFDGIVNAVNFVKELSSEEEE